MAASIVFPAFVNEYKGTENRINRDIGITFTRLLESVSGYLNTDLTGFDFRRNNFLDDELKSQYISYIFSCSVAGFLKNKNFSPSFVSGYSMGIYAALHYCGSIDFLQGIKMITQAWEILCRATEGDRFGMGMIIGLDETDMGTLIQDRKEIEISNQNNPYTFILSGTRQAIEIVLEAAREAGAMRISLLPVSKPYHSRFLKRASPEFAEAIGDIDFMPPLYPYISAMDQNMITTGDGLRKEVIVNLSSRMNWMKTMNSLVSNGSDRIFECGAGDGLTRNARFIEGQFQSFSVDKLEKFIESAADK
jgi:[acyl-carrier-protein] S-malonyltransferase